MDSFVAHLHKTNTRVSTVYLSICYSRTVNYLIQFDFLPFAIFRTFEVEF